MFCRQVWFPSNVQRIGRRGEMRVSSRIPGRPVHPVLPKDPGLLQLSHLDRGEPGSEQSAPEGQDGVLPPVGLLQRAPGLPALQWPGLPLLPQESGWISTFTQSVSLHL